MDLGFKPDKLRVLLTTGADFYSQITLVGGTFPVGSTLSLKFGSGSTWTATRDSSTVMTFDEDKAVTDLIADGDTVNLNFTDGASDRTWAIGTAVRNG